MGLLQKSKKHSTRNGSSFTEESTSKDLFDSSSDESFEEIGYEVDYYHFKQLSDGTIIFKVIDTDGDFSGTATLFSSGAYQINMHITENYSDAELKSLKEDLERFQRGLTEKSMPGE